jgi:glycosyltransferase involved in cell wall biosynthesis
MRIGLITDETDGQLVGFGNYTIELVKSILKLDRKNEYFLIHKKKEDRPLYKLGAKEIIVPSGRFPYSVLRNFVILPWKLRKYKLDVVHHITSTGPFVFKPLMNFKAVETIHEVLPLQYPKCFELPVRLVFRMLLPSIAKNSSYIFTAGQVAKDYMVKHFGIKPEKICIIYPGINPAYKPIDRLKCKELLKKKYHIKDNFILFISSLEAKKNVPTLIKAYKRLKERGIMHKLVLVGRKGYGYAAIESTIKDLGLDDVIMPGYVPFEDLPAFYNAADVFAYPAFDGGAMPVFEAMSCGCPVVVSNGGSSMEAFGNSVVAVDTNDVEAYANAIKQITGSKKLSAELSRKGLQQSKNFSWEKSATITIQAYESLLDKAL